MQAFADFRQFATQVAGLAALGMLVACGSGGLPGGDKRAESVETTQFRMVPASRAWLYVPDGLLTLERDLGHVQEQRVALSNQTTMDGDNVMLMRTRKSSGRGAGRLKLKTFTDRPDGLPAPFADARHGQMQIAEDAMGSYFFLTKTMGPGVVCVLAIRAVSGTARMLPNGATAVDVMLRNCTTGDQATALKPIQATALGRAVGVTASGEQAPLHTQSPFAAPGAAVR